MRLILIAAICLASGALSAQGGWRLETPAASWIPRDGHFAVAYDGSLWIATGSAGNLPGGGGGAQWDIWSSPDGVSWVTAVNPTPWNARTGAAVVEFASKLWLLGGNAAGQGHKNDVWYSDDGVSWIQAPDAPWTGRAYHTAVVWNGKVWVLGGLGRISGQYFMMNDIWSSPDGANWTHETNAPWDARHGHTAAVFDGRMWILGGTVDLASLNVRNISDVWSSPDGVNWTQEAGSTPWGAVGGRSGHTIAVLRGRMWIFGGLAYQYPNSIPLNDAWSSVDGASWFHETIEAPWSARYSHATTVHDGRIWVFGGADHDLGRRNDVWSYGLHIRPDTLPDGVAGEPYAATLEAREGDGPYVWAFTGGSLPPGLVLDTSTTATTLPITGTPSQVGTFNFTIHLTDDNGYTAEQQITIQINPPPPLQTESSSNSGCALQHVPVPAWLLLPAAIAYLRRRRAVAR